MSARGSRADSDRDECLELPVLARRRRSATGIDCYGIAIYRERCIDRSRSPGGRTRGFERDGLMRHGRTILRDMRRRRNIFIRARARENRARATMSRRPHRSEKRSPMSRKIGRERHGMTIDITDVSIDRSIDGRSPPSSPGRPIVSASSLFCFSRAPQPMSVGYRYNCTIAGLSVRAAMTQKTALIGGGVDRARHSKFRRNRAKNERKRKKKKERRGRARINRAGEGGARQAKGDYEEARTRYTHRSHPPS